MTTVKYVANPLVGDGWRSKVVTLLVALSVLATTSSFSQECAANHPRTAGNGEQVINRAKTGPTAVHIEKPRPQVRAGWSITERSTRETERRGFEPRIRV